MEIEKQVLPKSENLSLSLPEGGFSDEFLNVLSGVCGKDQELDAAYLVLKQSEEVSSLFFSFLFNDDMASSKVGERISNLMSNILELFKEEVDAEAICLNNQVSLKDSISSLTTPFYKRH